MDPKTTPSIEFRDVAHEFWVSAEGRVSSVKEWVIQRLSGRATRPQMVTSLEGINLEVESGQALGIVGRNGAGKSTLLRIAAGILQPMRGEAIVRGNVAPVIELGLGFEHELTGRENIFFNGAILGRSHQEMSDRMDAIVGFAELEDVIDRPIRTYSTGMVARLAFSVATTVEAQILLLDEVLSVGDEGFKMKCQERMEAFRRQGVTFLFVSHDLEAVERICDEVVWIDGGRIRCQGPAAEVVERYRRGAPGPG